MTTCNITRFYPFFRNENIQLNLDFHSLWSSIFFQWKFKIDKGICTSWDEFTENYVSVDEDDWITSQEEKSFFFNKAAGASVFFSLYEPGFFAKNIELHILKYLSSRSSSVFGVQPKPVPNVNSAKSLRGEKQTNKQKRFSCIFHIFFNPFLNAFTFHSTWTYTWSALFRSDC